MKWISWCRSDILNLIFQKQFKEMVKTQQGVLNTKSHANEIEVFFDWEIVSVKAEKEKKSKLFS